MKKRISLFLVLILLISLFAAFPAFADQQKIHIVTTIYPIYDWVSEIVKGNEQIELSLLQDSGVDLHSFQPTAQDILRIVTSDLFIYIGGESDEWVEAVLAEGNSPNQKTLNLMELLGEQLKEEERVEGMEAEEEETEGEAIEYDEHIWLSLRNAKRLVLTIADTIAELDPDQAELYHSNAAAYSNKLDQLDAQYSSMTKEAVYHTVLFGDRFPFRYLVDDYGLEYYAAFSGCSAESEASFSTIVFLAQKMDELGLPAVLTIESSDQSIAKTIVAATQSKNQKVLTMNSLQGKPKAGENYLSVMEGNLLVLTEALSGASEKGE